MLFHTICFDSSFLSPISSHILSLSLPTQLHAFFPSLITKTNRQIKKPASHNEKQKHSKEKQYENHTHTYTHSETHTNTELETIICKKIPVKDAQTKKYETKILQNYH